MYSFAFIFTSSSRKIYVWILEIISMKKITFSYFFFLIKLHCSSTIFVLKSNNWWFNIYNIPLLLFYFLITTKYMFILYVQDVWNWFLQVCCEYILLNDISLIVSWDHEYVPQTWISQGNSWKGVTQRVLEELKQSYRKWLFNSYVICITVGNL